MSTPTPIIEGFSLSHVEILDGSKTFRQAWTTQAIADFFDVYGVNQASLDPQVDDFDNEGDNDILSTWMWLTTADISVQAGYLSFPMIATLTGAPLSSSGTGLSTSYEMDLWSETQFNVAPKPAIVVMPGKDHMGLPLDLVIGLYKIQFGPMTFDGPSYKEGLKVNFNGKALKSLYDEKGIAHTDGKRKVGRMLAAIHA